MKITIACDVLGTENNGQSVAAFNLINYLKSAGHEVRVLCGDQTRKGQEGFFVVPTYNFGKLLNKYVAKVGVTIAKPQKKIVESAIVGADVVHIMTPFMLGCAALKVAERFNIPVTAGFHAQAENFTAHLQMQWCQPLNHAFYTYNWKHFYRRVDGIHFPTTFIRDLFERNIHHKTKAFVISNGVNNKIRKRATEKPDEWKDKIVILTIGRYAREKSQDTLLKAISLSKHKDSIQLVLAGQGVKEKYYKRLGEKLPIPPVFKLYSHEEIANLINCCDLYVHPAEMELEGISCIEAIACGKLTICSSSKRSATRTFVPDERCLFKNRSPKDLARVIDFWLDHPEERMVCEEEFLQSSVVFNQDECMKRMEEMLQQVINEKNSVLQRSAK